MYEAKVIEDSIAKGVRLTTFSVTFPRFILAEFNTHRAFCLAGDMELEFDLPGGSTKGAQRVHRMRTDEFVDKWLHGARRYGANPKREYDLTWVEANRSYSTEYAASKMGMANATNLNTAARTGTLKAHKEGRTWWVQAEDLLAWRSAAPEHTRFDMRAKLSGMRIRQLNVNTGDIQWSTVKDVCISGEKEVYEVIAGDYTVAGSKDHRVLTVEGWKTIGDLTTLDKLVVRKFGKRDEDRTDPMRLKRIDGVWRSVWQRHMREKLRGHDPLCRRCQQREGVDIHHLVPVCEDPSRALDETNVTLLCVPCHHGVHETQGWQGGTYLYGAAVPVEEVRLRGVEQTYDLEIAGQYPNFLANGVVVHNSRNSASSRAVPVQRRMRNVIDDPFIPEGFGANKAGMQAGEELSKWKQWVLLSNHWFNRWMCLFAAWVASKVGSHKQWANRYTEFHAFHQVVVTATDWENFFALRVSRLAQPEIYKIAKMMEEEYKRSTPKELKEGEWHLPYVLPEERIARLSVDEVTDTPDGVRALLPAGKAKLAAWLAALVQFSVARCARTSYETHETGKIDQVKDIELYGRLTSSRHMSPHEHPARVGTEEEIAGRAYIGNFKTPWIQHRKDIPDEAVAPREVL